MPDYFRQKKFYCIIFILISNLSLVSAQTKNIRGVVLNEFTKEPIPFASIYFKKANYGVVSDSIGTFSIRKSIITSDSLIIKYVGYDELKRLVSSFPDTIIYSLYIKESAPTEGVVVKTKFNKGLRWWRNFQLHKAQNNPYRFENYQYELYNKLELDINNINKKTIDNYKALKAFSFLLNNIDSLSEAKPFLPVFLTESLSDYYYSNNPYKVREEIKAAATNGIKNESLMQFMGGINQKINLYQDYVKVFDKEFISPLANFADKYYNFKGADTQYIREEKYFHLLFSPKQEGTNTFSGDCWIHSKTWAIQKINATISPNANINFVNRLSLVQEFSLINDSTWMFSKDKFIADVLPFKKNKFSFLGRKTTTYKDVIINNSSIQNVLSRNKLKEEVVMNENAKQNSKAFWEQKRHESLNSNEVKVYKMIDTLKQMPLFKTYTNRLLFLTDGHKQFGLIEIGPWFKWFSSNQLERKRIRFDIGTTPKFSKHLRIYGYLAYGFGDERLKEKLAFTYKIPKHASWSIASAYSNDLDNGRIRFNENDESTIDNLFSRFIRRKGITQKFINIEAVKFSVKKEWENNLTTQLGINRSIFNTFAPLPSSRLFANNNIVNTDFGLHIHYAPGEKKITGKRKSFTIKGHLPITDINYSFAVPDVFKSEYKYQKLTTVISQSFRIPRWGTVDYMTYGGRIVGDNIPFMLLEVHPGNEVYYYSKHSFNLMNRFEYVSDFYGGINIEHHFDKKLFNLIPFLRKTKMRQFWNVKTVWGDISPKNRLFNRLEFGSYRLKTLRGKPYTEIGTGIDNIFNCFRVDLVWRLASEPNRNTIPPPTGLIQNNIQNFGVFGSFRLQF